MRPDDFFYSRTGRLVEAVWGDQTYWAFVPKPLPLQVPPELELWNLTSEARGALGELAGLCQYIPEPGLLLVHYIRREAVHSSRIEGTQAAVSDMVAYDAGQLNLPGFNTDEASGVREVSNYVRALHHGIHLLDELPVCQRLIRETHGILMEGVRGEDMAPGEFRREQVWIGPDPLDPRNPQKGRFVPPPADLLADALDAWEKYVNAEDDLPPLVRLALIHYQFETIHPFLDGNGRIGRLLVSLLTVHWGLLPSPMLYLSAYFDRHVKEYQNRLYGISARNEVAAWVKFFLKGVVEQARDGVRRARALVDLRKEWRVRARQEGLSDYLPEVVESLIELPIADTAMLIATFGMSAPTAGRVTRELESLGMLTEITGQRRNRKWVSWPIMRILQGEDEQ